MIPMARSRLAASLTIAALLVLAATTATATARKERRFAELWSDPAGVTKPFETIFIVGITDDTERRIAFEDKFVTRLRTHKIEGVTSHRLVPRLDEVEDREALLKELEAKGVDAAITVRVVPLKPPTEEEWSEAWNAWVRSSPLARDLILEALPASGVKAKRYGVEVALWDSSGWRLLWAARSDLYKRSQLRDDVGPFVERTIAALQEVRFLE
jgi:hypothetical protein